MDLYDIAMAPVEKLGLEDQRRELIKNASGAVLEIGAGNGANLPFYNFEQISSLVLTDKNIKNLKAPDFRVTLKEVDAEKLPFENSSFDCVVATLLFCTIDVGESLKEVHRVLKDGGRILFIEHVIPEKKVLKSMANIVNPVWKRLANGCNVNRDFFSELSKNGFTMIDETKFFNNIFISGIAKK